MRNLFITALTLLATSAMAIDLAPLWDFNQPTVSEQRFRAALETASGDDRLILLTQVARTQGLRENFDGARAVLQQVEPSLPTAGAEARTRYFLELGRSWASAKHAPEALTDDAKARARSAFQSALDTAKAAGLDSLAIDAVHMFAFIDTAPEQQLQSAQQALAIAQASSQPAAQRWEASVRNNVGHALHQLGRYDQALDQFRTALTLREQRGNGKAEAEATRTAWWMVAWTLRALNRGDEALAIQLRLEHEADAAAQPDPYVYEELALLFKARGDTEQAAAYEAKKMTVEK
ncbi:MAG: tetratricopeptide repeat protein [Rubrivivax sp.]